MLFGGERLKSIAYGVGMSQPNSRGLGAGGVKICQIAREGRRAL